MLERIRTFDLLIANQQSYRLDELITTLSRAKKGDQTSGQVHWLKKSTLWVDHFSGIRSPLREKIWQISAENCHRVPALERPGRPIPPWVRGPAGALLSRPSQ